MLHIFTLVIYNINMSFCCFLASAYTTTDRLCAVFSV